MSPEPEKMKKAALSFLCYECYDQIYVVINLRKVVIFNPNYLYAIILSTLYHTIK